MDTVKSKIDFNKMGGLIPVVVQDSATLAVLMLGYMNEEALDATLASRKVTFFSRSRQKLWLKGETSGNFLNLVSLKIDCDGDSLLVTARPVGPTCHSGSYSCFFDKDAIGSGFIGELDAVIAQRKQEMPEGSYTTRLFQKGLNKIAQKVGEEAVETVIASKDDDRAAFLGEAADLMYHLLVLLHARGENLTSLATTLQQRHI